MEIKKHKNKIIVIFILLLLGIFILRYAILIGKTDSYYVEKINDDFSRGRALILTMGEGEKFIPASAVAKSLACRPGLNTVRNMSNAGFGCGFSEWRSEKTYVCVKCGNGFCGKGENICNCAKDCGRD